MAYRKAKITAVSLCNGVRFIGGKLVGRVAHGNEKYRVSLSKSKVRSHDMLYVLWSKNGVELVRCDIDIWIKKYKMGNMSDKKGNIREFCGLKNVVACRDFQ